MRLSSSLISVSLPVVTILTIACAIGATPASAEDGGPRLLLLEKGIKTLEAKFKGGGPTIENLAGTLVDFESSEMTWKSCEPIAGTEEKDTSACNALPLAFQAGKCKSEGSERGVILALVDVRLAAELSATNVLQPLLVMKILNTKSEAVLKINCGVALIDLKGTIGCLMLPGLENIPTTRELEIVCRINAVGHDPETGKCESSCEWLVEDPFSVEFAAGFEDAWMELKMSGRFNKDIFLDD